MRGVEHFILCQHPEQSKHHPQWRRFAGQRQCYAGQRHRHRNWTGSGQHAGTALIDAASGDTFELDGVFASAGNTGAKAYDQQRRWQQGTVVLGGANTSWRDGDCQLGHCKWRFMALQDSALITIAAA